MFLLIATALLIFTGVGECFYKQKLKCPYTSEQKPFQRVWCKRIDSNHDCCTGFTFSSEVNELEGGNLSVQDNGQAFVVTISRLTQGDGVYWCGLKNGSNIIVKLAESQLYTRQTGKQKKRDMLYESVIEEKLR
ncbi:trem-like transcript 4 protein isoform X2 [Hoplias malabaricus]|uniref:trem-like transcript 4 protein isoform X2 n=1 Tax=Hoplias malabaricus TaxID=27720 RepID=UPI0034622A4D